MLIVYPLMAIMTVTIDALCISSCAIFGDFHQFFNSSSRLSINILHIQVLSSTLISC